MNQYHNHCWSLSTGQVDLYCSSAPVGVTAPLLLCFVKASKVPASCSVHVELSLLKLLTPCSVRSFGSVCLIGLPAGINS